LLRFLDAACYSLPGAACYTSPSSCAVGKPYGSSASYTSGN